ncbi:hypothetical protein DL240_09170 [Lujinxingia litoralis]|uniref:Uncharacterized protein n=1 Tax=Lujinxingia litoralis TaxID=2211119 RepID=A0A328C705_9DELT|nr:hypothetical protein [Lujinxingia litoralis]RAL23046.1 hypothetical protein DL240_09170 [Lujinxingia litoralis]
MPLSAERLAKDTYNTILGDAEERYTYFEEEQRDMYKPTPSPELYNLLHYMAQVLVAEIQNNLTIMPLKVNNADNRPIGETVETTGIVQ